MHWLAERQHRRYNPLLDEWVLVSPHRTQRPWQGSQEKPIERQPSPEYDSTCYLCPGNRRANGAVTPQYTKPFVFENDFAALRPDTEPKSFARGEMLRADSEYGTCRVLCYAPQHNIHIADMSDAQVADIITLWGAQYAELARDERITHVQIFENRGAAMGASNPHPHGQIWANESIPNIALRKTTTQHTYWDTHASAMLCGYLSQELELGERIIAQNEQFVWLVPFWAVWPYETYIIPHRHIVDLGSATPGERTGLAQILKLAINTYDKLFNTPFPYSMGVHLPPTTNEMPAGAGGAAGAIASHHGASDGA